MKKKLASVLLCAVMAASMLTGCGNADNATATTPATDNKTDEMCIRDSPSAGETIHR